MRFSVSPMKAKCPLVPDVDLTGTKGISLRANIHDRLDRLENVMMRTKNLIKIWLIAFGIFLVSGCDVIDRTVLDAFPGESGTAKLTKSTMDNRIESSDAASTASQSQAQASKMAIQVPRSCDATLSYNPLPIAIIRFNGKESDFVRPLKAALNRITTLKEDVGFKLQMVIPNSYLEDRENIDVVTPRQHIEKIRNSLISFGISENDMIYTARDSRSNSTYEVHVFALEICPDLIQGPLGSYVQNGSICDISRATGECLQ